MSVGYGATSKGEKYYILKNTWATTWGMDGYMLLERGVNRCGVVDYGTYPVVTNPASK
jgi:hypothetical protein